MKSLALGLFVAGLFVVMAPVAFADDGVGDCLQKGVGSLTGNINASFVRSRKFRTFVWLQRKTGGVWPPTGERQVVDQRDWKFVPRFLVITPGTEVLFRNSDTDVHNVHSLQEPNYPFGDMLVNDTAQWRFDTPGAYRQLCNIHPRMTSLIIVVPSPYHTFVDRRGSFSIDAIPDGKWLVRVANEKMTDAQLKEVTEVTITECGVTQLPLVYLAEELKAAFE